MPLSTFMFLHTLEMLFSLSWFNFAFEFCRKRQLSPRGSGQKSTANNLSSPRQFTQPTTGLVLLRKLSKTAPKRRKTFSKAICLHCVKAIFGYLTIMTASVQGGLQGKILDWPKQRQTIDSEFTYDNIVCLPPTKQQHIHLQVLRTN